MKTDAEYAAQWKANCTITADGCWLWNGFCQKFRNIKPGQRGYPGSAYRGKGVRVHRQMLVFKLGRPIGEGLHACHTCDNPPCINPAHLYEATNQQNHLDGGKRKRMQGQTKTHCHRGHEFTPENTYWSKRGASKCRNCSMCQRIRMRMAAGWTREQAEQLPLTPPGHQPVGAKWHE